MRGDEPSPTRSAVLTRLSHGHIRIGTFQRLAAFGEAENIAKLVRYCLEQLYGEAPADDDSANAPAFVRPGQPGNRDPARLPIWPPVSCTACSTATISTSPARASITVRRASRPMGPGVHRGIFRPLRPLAFGRQPEAIHWDLAQFAGCLTLVAEAPPLAEMLGGWSGRFEAALVGAMLSRLGIAPIGGDVDREPVAALVAALQTREATIDRPVVRLARRPRSGRGGVPVRAVPGARRHAGGSQTPADASILVGRGTVLDAYRGGRGDLVRNRGTRRLAAARRQDYSRSPDGRRDEGRCTDSLTTSRRWSSRRPWRTIGFDRPGDRRGNLVRRARRSHFEVEAARATWPAWAAHSVAYRIESVRRFANVVRKQRERVCRADRQGNRQAFLGSADRSRSGGQQGRHLGRGLCRAHCRSASSRRRRQPDRGAPQAARRARGAWAV